MIQPEERPPELSPEIEETLAQLLESVDDPNMQFIEDGEGGYRDWHGVIAEIRKGTDEGRDLLECIMAIKREHPDQFIQRK